MESKQSLDLHRSVSPDTALTRQIDSEMELESEVQNILRPVKSYFAIYDAS